MIRLHGYWRSGAAYRVRIALALKGIAYEQVSHDLRAGAQSAPDYAALNPQRLVPALEADGAVLTQSVAIIEWLEERYPMPPLLPADLTARATVRALVATIASDIHPLHNLRIGKALRAMGQDEAGVTAWNTRWFTDGFAAIEATVARHGAGFAIGSAPTIADCFTVPALYSAARFGVDVGAFPHLVAAGRHAAALPAVQAAHPDLQPDADPG
jgi:maleylpyruvate isomerase